MSDTGWPDTGPLAGLRILDLTMALAGAYTTMLLADMGAEVIKVESLGHYPTPTKGPRDVTKDWGPSVTRDYPDMDPGPDPWNRLSWFNSQARGKRDVTVDLTTERGRELFLALVERSDGLVENNAAGVLERLGLDPEILLTTNPRLVVLRMPPLGLWGPDSGAIGFGWHFESLSGIAEVQGYPDGSPVGSILMDAATGPSGATAMMMGLLERETTGEGQLIELAQVENLIHYFGDVVADAYLNRRPPRRWGNEDPNHVPQGVYRCAGDDEWLALSVRDQGDWRQLVAVLGDDGLSEDWDEVARRDRTREIDAAIAHWTAGRSKEVAFHELQTVGVPAGPVMNEEDAFADSQLQEREFFQYLEHPSAGGHFHPGFNFKMSDAPTALWRAAPTLGQDNEYVFKQILGLSDVEYQELIRQRCIGDTYL